MTQINSDKQNTEYARIRYIRQNTAEYAKRGIFGGALLALLALSLCCFSAPVSAQGFVTPTPLPAIVATQQAAAQQLSSTAAQNAEADRLDAQAAEIRRNADAQAAQAAQAYADARAANAAQNAGAIGEAIGRGEAALEQIKISLDGALRINEQRSAIMDSLIVSLTQKTSELDQARLEVASLKTINERLDTNNKTIAQKMQDNERSGNVLSILPVFLAFLFLIGIIVLALGLRQWRRGVTVVSAQQVESEVVEDEKV